MAFTDDQLTLWVISGIIGSVVRELFDLIVMGIGLPIIHIVSLAADLFTNNLREIKSFTGILTGTLTDWTMGAVIGVVMGLVLQWSGRRNYLLKGIGFGVISWVFIFGFIVGGLPHMFIFKPPIFNILFAVVPHCIYAGTTVFCIVRFSKIKSN